MEHADQAAPVLNQRRRIGRLAGLIASVGLSLCALCCAAPLLIAAGIGGTALLAYAAVGEKVGMGLAVAAITAYLVARFWRRSARSCSIDCAARPRKA